jgi:Protein of unknown function (DUF4065)
MNAQQALGRLTFGEDIGEADARLRELILYISERCFQDHAFGATKLAKILYFSDSRAFARYGSSISGSEYMSLPQGPVPRHLLFVREQLEGERALAIHRAPFHGLEQHKPIPLREANLSLFTANDIALLDTVIAEHWGRTATEMSNLSHDRIWQIAGTQGRRVPQQAVFISSAPLTAYDVQRTKELAEKHGWGGL